MASNCYLQFESYHHPACKMNIPMGLWLKRNCSKSEDYITQSQIMTKKFLEKGYTWDLLSVTSTSCADSCPNRRRNTPSKQNARFITGFNYRNITKVMNKHWHVLQSNPNLGLLLPEAPQVVFRRASMLKNMVALSISKSRCDKSTNIRGYFENRVGIFQCKKRGCLTCQSIPHSHPSITDRRGKDYAIRQFITFDSVCSLYAQMSM